MLGGTVDRGESAGCGGGGNSGDRGSESSCSGKDERGEVRKSTFGGGARIFARRAGVAKQGCRATRRTLRAGQRRWRWTCAAERGSSNKAVRAAAQLGPGWRKARNGGRPVLDHPS